MKTNRKTGVILLFSLILMILTSPGILSQPPRGWILSSDRSGYKASVDNKIFYHGRNSAMIESTVENSPSFCTLMQNMVVNDFNGKRMKMTGYIRSEGVHDSAQMWVRVDDIDRKISADFDNMSGRALVGIHDWTRCEIVFDVPRKSLIFFGFILNGPGKMWADNVSFEAVPASVAKTAKPVNAPLPDAYLEQIKNVPEQLQDKLPENLDFEEDAARGISTLKTNLPKADLHVHLSRGYGSTTDLRYRKASELAGQMGVIFGIAEEIDSPDITRNGLVINEFAELANRYNLYLGLQVNQPGWTRFYSKESLSKVDYIAADALRFPDKNGQVRLLWLPGVIFEDAQEFMDRYVEYNLKVMSEPIDIWVNATFLPESLASQYDRLWTDARMKKVIDAAVKNNIAIEINSRYQIPGKKFIKMAKAAGAHFTFGSNQHDTGIGEIGWAVSIADECGITADDLFFPERKLSQLNK